MIRDRTARRIASEWHGGQWTGLYALASSGAIIVNGDFSGKPFEPDPDVETRLNALDEAIVEWGHVCTNRENANPMQYTAKDQRDLENLIEYIRNNGPRGPVEGWGKMKW